MFTSRRLKFDVRRPPGFFCQPALEHDQCLVDDTSSTFVATFFAHALVRAQPRAQALKLASLQKKR